MKGIPTVYAGVQFRSRLEARFAAWFDLLEWPWDYEPFDYDGWIPDFRTGNVLWEVKPHPGEFARAIEKVQQADPSLPVIVSCGWENEAFGVHALVYDNHPETDASATASLCVQCQRWFPCAPWIKGSWDSSCQICGSAGAGVRHVTDPEHVRRGCVFKRSGKRMPPPFSLWRAAGNPVQWRSPRRT